MNPTTPPIGSSSETPDSTAYQSLLGLEIEMVPVHAGTGASQPVSRYFDALRSIKLARGERATPFMLQGRCVALHTAAGECGLDNGFNLLETALAPVRGGSGGLTVLARLAHEELADTMSALLADDACILNASQHPACRRDADWYGKVCVPRPIYDELRGYRGWHHWEGIDAKAQNGANTSVRVRDAVAALNISLALAPAAIALFGNSPLESGRVTGLKETRMTLWPRMFGPARFAGDAWLSQYPGRPFHNLGDFFTWMFGEGTVSRALPLGEPGDYKSVATAVLANDPCLSAFLKAPGWAARCLDTGMVTHLLPDTAHFEYSQIGQFLDARLRYALHTRPPLAEVLAAWQQEHGLEQLFEQCGAQFYIEARAPGAGFADAALLEDAGPEVAHSMLLAPIALQCGLLANLDEATRLVGSWGWQPLGRLRQPAMQRGMEDDRVAALCTEVLAVARDGLAMADRPWLAYADHVLQTRRSAADRMLASWHAASGTPQNRLAFIARRHAALHPDRYGGLGVQPA